MFGHLLFLLALTSANATSALPTAPPPISISNEKDSAAVILQRFADAWRGSEEMTMTSTITVGVRVSGDGGGEFTMTIGSTKGAGVRTGLPSEPFPILETDIETLRKIDRGEMSAMTAMAREEMTDRTPLDVRFPPGFRWTPEAQALYLPLTFHLFCREVPEVVRFGEGTSRLVHGGNSAIFYYDRGLRTTWYQLKPGMHVNEAASQKKNPFASLFVITRGEVRATIGRVERTLHEGEAVYVPPQTPHEFRVDERGYAEFILVMFGDGA